MIHTTNAQQAAADQIAKGRPVVPILPGLKRPSDENWPNVVYTVADFTASSNLGVKLDKNIVEADCDCVYAVQLAPIFLPPTGMAHGRPSKGISHYWFSISGEGITKKYVDVPDAENPKGKTLIELRGGKGKQTVIPPSSYKEGTSWESLYWRDGREGIPADVDLEDLRKAIAKIAVVALVARHWNCARHDAAMHFSGLLVRGGIDEEDILEMVDWVCRLTNDEEREDRLKAAQDTLVNHANGESVTGGPSLSELMGTQVTMKIVKWLGLKTPTATSEPAQNLHTFEASDVGNAEAVQCLYGDVIHYSGAVGWLTYTGKHWQAESESCVDQMIVDTLRKRRTQASRVDNDAVMRCCKLDNAKITACRSRLKSLPGIEIDITSFDNEPFLLNTKSGVVDLHTGNIVPHSAEYLFTYCLSSEVGTKEDAAAWLAFVSEAVDGNDEVLDYLQRSVGYSLTGSTKEEILFYLHGPTRSGKGTFIESLLTALSGPLAKSADFNSFTQKRESGDQGFDLAPLRPARFVTASESNKYQYLNPAKVKGITGGDDVTCSFKHKDQFTYRPQYKVWLVSNHPCNGDADDDALWSRVRVIRFPTSHLGREDKKLKSLLKDERSQAGILWWAIQGCVKYDREGLAPPKMVEESTREHRDLSDSVLQWMDEKTERGDSLWSPSSSVTSSYTAWCKENNVEPKSGKWLAFSLAQKGCVPERRGSPQQVRGYRGLKVLDYTTVTVKK